MVAKRGRPEKRELSERRFVHYLGYQKQFPGTCYSCRNLVNFNKCAHGLAANVIATPKSPCPAYTPGISPWWISITATKPKKKK